MIAPFRRVGDALFFLKAAPDGAVRGIVSLSMYRSSLISASFLI